MNVLKKIVVPRTHVSIGYILSELEEMEREEFHRLKKIKEKKKKHTEEKLKLKKPNISANTVPNEEPSIHLTIKRISVVPKAVTPGYEDMKQLYKSPEVVESVTKLTTLPCEAHQLDSLKRIFKELIGKGTELLQFGFKNIDTSEFLNMCERTRLNINEFFKIDAQRSDKIDASMKQKIINLKAHLNKVIDITEEFRSEVSFSGSVENFIRVCQDVGRKLDNYKDLLTFGENELETQLNNILNVIKKITAEYKKQGVLSQDIDSFIKSCDAMKSKLEKRTKIESTISCSKTKLTKADQSLNYDASPKIEFEYLERKIEHLKSHLQEVIVILKEIEPELKLLFNVESFTEMCEEVDEKLNIHKEDDFIAPEDNNKTKLMELRDLITSVTNITKDYKNSGILSTNVEEFLESCDEMMLKIDNWPQPSTSLGENIVPSLDTDLRKSSSVHHKKVKIITDSLDTEAKEEGVVHESVDDFIKLFEEVESNNQQQPNDLLDLQSNIQEVSRRIKDLKENLILSGEIEGFLELCDEPENKMHISNNKIESQNNSRFSHNNSRTRLPQQIKAVEEDPPFQTCSSTFELKKPSIESLCNTCSNSVNKQSSTTNFQGKSNSVTESELSLNNMSDSSQVTDDLGFYEMQTQKKIKVTIRMKRDGTVWEEKETITTEKVSRNPTATSLPSDTDDSSDEYLEGNTKHINICTFPSYNRNVFKRFLKFTQSECRIRNPQSTGPCLRLCISLDNVFYF